MPYCNRFKSGLLVGVEPYPTGYVRLQVEKAVNVNRPTVFDGIIGLLTAEEAEQVGRAVLAAAARARRPH